MPQPATHNPRPTAVKVNVDARIRATLSLLSFPFRITNQELVQELREQKGTIPLDFYGKFILTQRCQPCAVLCLPLEYQVFQRAG